MKDQEIELETAILAWEKGFPKKIGKITQSLLQKWLREEKDLFVYVIMDSSKKLTYIINSEYYYDTGPWNGTFYKYEEALERGLIEALNEIKKLN